VLANQRLAAARKAKGYEYKYAYEETRPHRRQRGISDAAQALVWLWQGYPIK